MSKTKNTDIINESGLERYFPESPKFDFRKDFEVDTLKRLIEGFKRHGIPVFTNLLIEPEAYDVVWLDRLDRIFLAENCGIELASGQERALEYIKEHPWKLRIKRGSISDKNSRPKRQKGNPHNRSTKHHKDFSRVTPALYNFFEHEVSNNSYDNSLDELIEKALQDTINKVNDSQEQVTHANNSHITNISVIKHTKESLEKEKEEFLRVKTETENMEELLVKNSVKPKPNHKFRLKKVREIRRYLDIYKVPRLKIGDINGAQIIITILIKTIENKKLSLGDYLLFEKLIEEIKSSNKRIIKSIYQVYLKKILSQSLSSTEYKVIKKVQDRNPNNKSIKEVAERSLVILKKNRKNYKFSIEDFHLFRKYDINFSRREKIVFFSLWLKQNGIKFVFNQETQLLFHLFYKFVDSKPFTKSENKSFLEIIERNRVILNKIRNTNYATSLPASSEEFSRVLKSEVVAYSHLLKDIERRYKKQAKRQFIDYYSYLNSESKSEENEKSKISVVSSNISYNKSSKIHHCADLETKALLDENTLIEFDFNQRNVFKDKSIPLNVIRQQFFNFYNDQLNSYFFINKKYKALIFKYLESEEDRDLTSLVISSRDFLRKNPEIDSKILFLFIILESLKFQVETFKKENVITDLTQSRKYFEFQLRKKGVEETTIKNSVNLLQQLERKYLSIKEVYFSHLLESQKDQQIEEAVKKSKNTATARFIADVEQSYKDFFSGTIREGLTITKIPSINKKARDVIKDIIHNTVVINSTPENPELIHIIKRKVDVVKDQTKIVVNSRPLILAQNRNFLKSVLEENFKFMDSGDKKSSSRVGDDDDLEEPITRTRSIKNISNIWLKIGILLFSLNLIIPILSLGNFSYNNPILAFIGVYILMSIVLGAFVFSSARKRFKTKIKHAYRKNLASLYIFGFALIVIGVLIFGFNFVLEGVIAYAVVFGLFCFLLPYSLKEPSNAPKEETSRPWVNEKNRLRQLRLRIKYSIRKAFSKLEIRRILKGLFITFNLILFPFIVGCFSNSLGSEILPAPSIATVPQDFRKNGVEYNAAQFDYIEEFKDLEGITFNSMFILKFSISAFGFKSFTLHAELIPEDVLVSGDLFEESKILEKTHRFGSRRYRGSFSTKDIYFGIDLDSTPVAVLPGTYQLRVYSIVQELFMQRVSNIHTYNITIEKDHISFNANYQDPTNPNYFTDPLRSTRRGSIYSIYNKERLRWENHFSTRAENSLGKPVSGEFSLYLTQREGFAQVYKKVTDYATKDNGLISYTNYTRTHHREYMRGKITYDGAQSLFYRDRALFEDCEVAEGSLIATSSFPDRPEYISNGTDWMYFNTNDFQITNQLYYHHEFNVNELHWTQSPNYYFPTPPPDIMVLDVSDDLSTYIESPIIGYLGTVAETAVFKYQYQLYNHGDPYNKIDVELKSQLYRNGELVYEQFDYQGWYNGQGGDWQVVNVNLTDYFTEAGQKFQIKIVCDFYFDPSYTDDISLRFDYANLNVFYDPTYYRSFSFENGFNEFSSPTISTSEPLYWDYNNLITLGNEILTYENYPGLITNNYFDQDFRIDGSWDAYSGLFSEEGQDLLFNYMESLNLVPTWRDIDGNSMAVFDLLGVTPPINVSDTFQSVISDEFTSTGDSDGSQNDIRQKYVTPKIVSNDKYIIIVFAGRYSGDDQWKIYMTYALRNDGVFSAPVRLYDPGDDAIYQLAPSIALSSTDLYVVWQQRNRDTHAEGETEWNIMYGRVSLSDFMLKDVMNVTTYDSANLDETAMVSPDVAVIPIGNRYDSNFDLIQAECKVFVSFENATWGNLTPGGRDNEGNDDITKNIYVAQLESSYLSSSFSEPVKISDKSTEYIINTGANIASPQILSQLCYNTSTILENSTEVSVNFDETTQKQIIELLSLTVATTSGETLLFTSEEDFVKLFGNNSLQFDQDKIVFPEDRMFMDLYDSRSFYFAVQTFISGTTEYELSPFFYENVSYVKPIKDVYYSSSSLSAWEIESQAERLSRDNYSIVGTFGTENLNISFTNELPDGCYFYIKYTLEEYIAPDNLTLYVSTVKNEVTVIFESFETSSEGYVYLDISNSSFAFQEDIIISNETNDTDISFDADFTYDYNNQFNIIYASQVNSSFTQLMYKLYNSSSSQFDKEVIITDSITMSEYDYYHMVSPILTLGFNNTFFIAYETNYRKTGETQKWKIQYMYLDVEEESTIGPFLIKSGDTTQERNPDSYWSNGNFWVFSSNSSNSWEIEFTSCYRSDLYTFSTLAADFSPLIFNWDQFVANMSVYFTLDLSSFTNAYLESEDRVRFIVLVEYDDSQEILLDTDWQTQDFDSWIQNNLATYYPEYLRYYYNLSFTTLSFSDINATDTGVQNNKYRFELNFPYSVNFTENFNLKFTFVKDDWNINTTEDIDRFQLGLDAIDVSFEIIPKDSTSDTFGVLTRSTETTPYSVSEFLISQEIELDSLDFLSDSSFLSDYYQSENNMVDLSIDFDAFSLLFDPIQQLQFASSDLECEMMVMVENEASPDITISDEILYENIFTGYYIGDINLESKWSKNFGSLYYSLDFVNHTVIIYNKEDYFELSTSEKQALFSIIQSLAQSYENIYLVFKFRVKTLDLNDYGYQNGINLVFNEFQLPIIWQNDSGMQQQNITFSKQSDLFTFFEKVSKESYLDLLSDFDIEIDNRDDFIAFSSFSNSYFPSGADGNIRYYLPTNLRSIEYMTPSDYLNLVNLHISDCVGFYDSFAGLLQDGPELSGIVGLVSPNLNTNETCDYNLRTILYTYPFFSYQNGTDIDKAIQEFKDELVKLKIEIYDQFNSKLMSEYSNTIIRMQDFNIDDFIYTTNSFGERFYYMKEPLKIYIYGQDILTANDYIYVKLLAEFLDTYYITTEKTFRNQWGLVLDELIFEFIQGDILPEFTNIAPFDILAGEVEIEARAVGTDYEWATLYYNYLNLGEYSGWDLVENQTQFNIQNNYAYFTFNWNTTQLTDDSLYKLRVVFQDTKGFQGNTTIANITVINSPPDITCNAFSLNDQGWQEIQDLEHVSGTIKLATINNDDLPLTRITYYLHDEYPTTQNQDNWTKLIELSNSDQIFDHFILTHNIKNGTWYLISEAENGGPDSGFNVYANRTLIDIFSNAINIGDTVGTQDSVSLALSDEIEAHIMYAKFWAQKQGESNWDLLNTATYPPFSAPFVNLPWTETTNFSILIEIKMVYPLFGICYFNLSKDSINFDIDGPSISVVQNSNDILYQIQQASGSWVATPDFNDIINGSITSSSQDFDTYRVSYDYGKGRTNNLKIYSANDTLQWDIKYLPDADVSFNITGYDTYNNPSNILEFSFINDQNYFSDLYIENYAFDEIHSIFESPEFKIYPVAQDIQVLNMTCGDAVYNFMRVDLPAEALYFITEIPFEPSDFNFENSNIDTKILVIKASDLKSQNIELSIPYIASISLESDVVIDDFQIEKNFYHIDMSEYTWWSFDEGSGYTIYDAAGSRHGTIVGSNNFVSGKVGNTAFEFDPTFYIPSQFSIEKGNVEYQGDFNWIDSNYTSTISDGPYFFVPAQPSNFTLVNGTSDWSGDMCLVDNNFTTFISQGPYPIQIYRVCISRG